MNGKETRRLRQGDGDRAVSPVIAVILMVAITVVLAATVYVWVSGFTDTGDQAPSANFRYVDCDPADENNVTVRLTSGGPLQLDDTRVIMFNQSADSQETQTDPIASDGQWDTGSQIRISEGDASTPEVDGDWDDAISDGLHDGDPYRLDFVHKPTESTYASLPFNC